MRQHRVRVALGALSVSALAIPLLAGAASAAPSTRVTVPGTTPAWATAAHAAGTPAASDTVSVRVALSLRDAAGAEQLAAALSDPNSAAYGRYLTPAAFNTRFAPTAASVDRVTTFLSGSGLHVTGVAEGNRWVDATGTVTQVNRAFGTVLRTYSWQGRTLRAPSGAVSVPAAVGADVATVTGLAQTVATRAPSHVKVPNPRVGPHAAATNGASPAATPPPPSQCSDFWGQHSQTLPAVDGRTSFPTHLCGYGPGQMRKAYGVDQAVASGTDGHGVTVAILDAYASPTMLADANQYATGFGDPAFARGQYRERIFRPFNLQNECGGEVGWNEEETLDVESVHGMAPGAGVLYVGAQNCDTGLDDAMNWVLQHHAADIVSNSYGWTGEDVPADELAVEHSMAIQAVLEGIGLYFSSGDDGDNVVDGLSPQPDYEASDPFVTAVGGTSLALDRRGNRVFEVGWESSLDFVDYSGPTAVYSAPVPGEFVFGAGGGTSTLFAQPWYQRGTVPGRLANRDGHKMRVSPDVATDADPFTGYFVGETLGGAFELDTFGGTSLACPLFAGIQALASQHRRIPIGFANPLLYSLGDDALRDVRPAHDPIHYASIVGGFLGTFDVDQGGTLATTRGYDNVTGLGTPNGRAFLRAESGRDR